MSKILHNGEWYDELSIVGSYYESEYEQIILSHVETVFPEYYTFPYKRIIYDDKGGTAKPDLAMIRKDYKEWYIVEVELEKHDFNHVKKQVKIFTNGIYDKETAEYIQNNQDYLNKDKLLTLIKTKQPSVLVIVDGQQNAWVEELEKYKSIMCVFQVFKNAKNELLYRLNGEYPDVFIKHSHCYFEKTMPNNLKILEPGILNFKNGEDIEIKYNSKISIWTRIDSNTGEVYLRVRGSNPANPIGNYILYQDSENKYILKSN